jgi:hypothetical protein
MQYLLLQEALSRRPRAGRRQSVRAGGRGAAGAALIPPTDGFGSVMVIGSVVRMQTRSHI